jgi:hypothetical protein
MAHREIDRVEIDKLLSYSIVARCGGRLAETIPT